MTPIKRTYNLRQDELSLIKQLKVKYKEFDFNASDIVRLGLYCANAFSEDQVKAIAQNLTRLTVGRPKKKKTRK